MNIEERNEKNKAYKNFRSVLHLGMGALYIALGVFVMYFKSFGAYTLPISLAYVFGILMLVYGAFRVWRGMADFRMKR